MWRSLVARLLWEQDVAGSNPAIPTGLTGGEPVRGMGFLSHRSCCQHLWTHRVVGDRMSMVSGCGLMVEHLEIKRTRFDSLKASPNFLVVCAERRRQQTVNLLHWKHRGFDSLHYHCCARNSRSFGCTCEQ